jgi:hypothetical protein
VNRWNSYGRNDSQLRIDGDPSFVGVDMLHDRAILGQGMLARSENKRLRDGPASTRAGTGFPGDFNPAFEDVIVGSYIYSNPTSEEVMLVATAGADYVWQLQFGKDAIKIDLDTDESIGTGNVRVEFVQAFDKVLLLRRPTTLPDSTVRPPLVWDGDPTHKFVVITLSDDGLKLVPTTWFGEPFENRVLYYFAYGLLDFRTKFIMSDILDYTSYDDVWATFRISAAGSDQITRLLAYQKSRLLVFMRHSVFAIENFTVDPTQAVQRVLSNKVGNMGNKVPLLVGAEAFFLSEHSGFYKVSQIIQDQIATEPIPISRPIQPIIDQIDWARTDSLGLDFVACSESLGDYCFFALPLRNVDGGANNVVLVYNTSTQQWESVPDSWDDPSFRIDALHVTRFDQDRRLFGLDYQAKRIYLMYESQVDHINDQRLNVKDVIETRGYVAGDPGGFKRFERVVIGIRTSDPDVTVTAISDGVDEEKELASFTKNPNISYVHGRGPRTLDPDAPKFEDYTLGEEESEFVGQDFEDLPVGDISVLPSVPGIVEGDVKQQSLERFQVRQIGRWCSIRVENTSGKCDVLGVGIEGTPIDETVKAVA